MPYSSVYAFGDSLVDPGNALELADAFDFLPFGTPDNLPTADKGYYLGRFTDGFTYTDLISNKFLGVATKPVFPFGYDDPFLGISFGFLSDPDGNNLNFAYGGAQIRQGDEYVPDMDDQTDAFKDAVDGHTDPNGLHIVTFGGNDIHELVPKFDPWLDPVAAQTHLQKDADEFIEELRDIIGTGARHILITGIPDVGIQPYYNDTPMEAERRAAATQYGETLDAMIRTQLAQLNITGVTIHYVSFTQMAGDIFDRLEGIVPASELYPLNESSLVFYDSVHPTAQMHALAAAYLLDALNGAPAGETLRIANPDFVQAGSIATAGEVDSLTFSLAANTSYTFELLGLSSGKLPGLASWQVLADPSLSLVGAGGLVASNDDGGLGLDARVQFTTGEAGLYTLQLSGVGMLTGAYTLQADNAAVRNDSYNIGNSSALVIEGEGGGTDRIYASVSYALADGTSIETLSTSNDNGKTAINLTGNGLDQTLIGNAGSNILDGKGGGDLLWGGAGKDYFAFTSALDGSVDLVDDFSVRDDSFYLENAIFTGLATGTLSKSAFVAGTAAKDATDRIIYDPATGHLFFDPDGTGALAQQHFATLDVDLKPTANDFLII